MFNIDNIYKELEIIKDNISSLKTEELLLKQRIMDYFAPEKQIGTQKVEHEGYRITFTTPKKVDWDTNVLSEIAERMAQDDVDFTDFIDVVMSVNENKYKSWSKEMQECVNEARTVREGATTFKIEKLEI